MKKKRKLIVIAIIVTVIIFLFPSPFSVFLKCFCGGCCEGCPGDCETTLGFPLTYYYSGDNVFTGRVSFFSSVGLAVDIVVWIFLIFLIYRFVYKKKKR